MKNFLWPSKCVPRCMTIFLLLVLTLAACASGKTGGNPSSPPRATTGSTSTTLTTSGGATPPAISSSAAWKIVASPNGTGLNTNTLSGVAAVSVNDVWAVGSYFNNRTSVTDLALTEHWNGRAWKIVFPPPAPHSSDNYLEGVKVISTNDIWAVGYSNNSDRTLSQTLTMHWDGTQWSVVASPNKGPGSNKLLAVSATSPSDIWAVGNFSNTNSGTSQTLTEHWNGREWTVVNSPVAPSSSDNFLSAVTASGKNNVWAVGYDYTIDQTTSRTLIEHWNGTQWTVVASPNTGTQNNQLRGVTAVSANDVWAVGFYLNSTGAVRTLTMYWNGTHWAIGTSANANSTVNQLIGVTALSATNVWAVGYSFTSHDVKQTLIEHWNGSKWSVVSSPNASTGDNQLNAVTKVPGTTQAWAVGYDGSGPFHGPQLTLTEHYA